MVEGYVKKKSGNLSEDMIVFFKDNSFLAAGGHFCVSQLSRNFAMDKQNSSDSSTFRLLLQHAVKVKKDIHSEFHELVAILKKREHDLCLEVDQKCLELLQEYEPPSLAIRNGVLITDMERLKKPDFLSSKLKFTGDLEWKHISKNYGVLRKVDCQKNTVCNPKTNDVLPEDTKNIFKGENMKPRDNDDNESSVSNDSFEVIDQKVCCGFNEMIVDEEYINVEDFIVDPKNIFKGENLKPEDKDDNESNVSNDSFEVIDQKTEFSSGNPFLSSIGNPAASPETVLKASLSRRRTPFSSITNQCCTNRLPRENEWLAKTVQERTEMPSDRIRASPCNTLFEICTSPTSAKSCSSNAAEVACGDNPRITIKTTFEAYLKQNDSKLWLHPNQSSNKTDSFFYGEWVAKDTTSKSSSEEDITNSPCRNIIAKDMMQPVCLMKPSSHSRLSSYIGM